MVIPMSVYITRINGMALDDTEQYRQNMAAGIAHGLGIKEMGIYRYDGELESIESLNARVDGIIAGIQKGDLVICQLPTGNGLKFEKALVSHVKAYGGRVAIFLHGLGGPSYKKGSAALREVISFYNRAEVLLVPSLAMRQFLLDNHIRRDMKFVIQEMWDHTSDASVNPERISGEGNQERFGFVWYQNRHERQYMEYSIPFSLSKFLSAGIPVIVPDILSVRRFLEENHLGLAVHSIEEAEDRVMAMDEAQYQGYVQCARQFAPALRKGYYTQRCLAETVEMFYRKDRGKLSVPPRVYHLGHPAFLSTVLRESYGGNLGLSWSYQGEADGFLICDADGKEISRADHGQEHYCLLKGYGKESCFVVKAYLETLKGTLIVAESELTALDVSLNAGPNGKQNGKRNVSPDGKQSGSPNGGREQSPKVSLVVPAYNAEGYVVRSIDTALAQSFPDLEILIVDDGSTDATPAIADWYAENYSNVTVIHQQNGGLPAARNTGIMEAKGDYIGFLDSDDMICPDGIAKLYRAIRECEGDIVISPAYCIKETGYEIFIEYEIEENTVIDFQEFFDNHYIRDCGFGTIVWNKLYRATLVKEHLFPLLTAEDEAWTPYVMSYAEKICYVKDCVYEYDRTVSKNTLANRDKSRSNEEQFLFYKSVVMFYLQNGNQKQMGLLKKLAQKRLAERERDYAYEEYGNLWKQIEKDFQLREQLQGE